MIQNDIYTWNDISEIDEKIFDDDSSSSDADDASIVIDNNFFFKSVHLDDYHISFRSKINSEFLNHKPRTSRLKLPKSFLAIIDLPYTGTV